MEHFKQKLVDIFEVSNISESDVIKDFDSWDSLTLLSLIAVVDAEYNIQINASLFEEIITIGDLSHYISKNCK
jgi:acyl carrier protein